MNLPLQATHLECLASFADEQYRSCHFHPALQTSLRHIARYLTFHGTYSANASLIQLFLDPVL